MVKDIRINKYFNFILLCILFISAHIVFANDNFQNNLLKVDLRQNGVGSIKLILYTSKPYNDSVSVNKKNDYEYVLLMPETSNSLTSIPTLKSMSDVVKVVNVKTQHYENQVKGYTKITILTLKPVEVIPQVQTLNVSDYKLSENDYKELMAQTAKKAKTKNEVVSRTAKTHLPPIKKGESVSQVMKTHLPPVTKNANVSHIAKTHLPPVTKNAGVSHIAKTHLPPKSMQALPIAKSKESLNKLKPQLRPMTTNKDNLYKPNNTTKGISSVKKQSLTQAKKTADISPATKQHLPITTNAKNENISHTVKPNLPLEVPVQQKVVTQATEEKISTVPEKPKVQLEVPTVEKIEAYVKTKGKFEKYVGIIINNIYIVLGLIFAGFILLLLSVLGARKMAKGFQKQKEIFASHLDERPESPVNYMDKINDDMNWKEKFQTFRDASAPSVEAPTQTLDKTNNSTIAMQDTIDDGDKRETFTPSEQGLNELFPDETPAAVSENSTNEEEYFDVQVLDENIQNEDEKYEPIENELFEESEIQRNEISQEDEISGYDKLDELFGPDEEVIEKEHFDFEDAQFQTESESLTQEQFETEEDFDILMQDEAESQGEIIKSEFAIDDKKGFYLVDIDDSTALVGHIEDEIFVLKRFEEKIDGVLQARLNEQNVHSTNYMTKVGDFKALIEVTPDNMNLLIEL